MLYLTSVLSKSSLSTAEEFGAGSAQFLGSRVISGYGSARPGKDCRGNGKPFLRTAAHDRRNYCWKPLKSRVILSLVFLKSEKKQEAVASSRAIY